MQSVCGPEYMHAQCTQMKHGSLQSATTTCHQVKCTSALELVMYSNASQAQNIKGGGRGGSARLSGVSVTLLGTQQLLCMKW